MTAGTKTEVLWNSELKLCRLNDRLLVFNSRLVVEIDVLTVKKKEHTEILKGV